MRHNLGHQSLKIKDLKKFESHNSLTEKLQMVYFQKKLNNAGILERKFFSGCLFANWSSFWKIIFSQQISLLFPQSSKSSDPRTVPTTLHTTTTQHLLLAHVFLV
jgi:hypothetical protein